MGTLRFRLDEIRPLARHALGCTKYRRTFVEEEEEKREPGPALHLVHDQGVYVMSNGLPMDMVGSGKSRQARVAYAAGCDPHRDAAWWEESRALVGGDDFVEPLPLEEGFRAAVFDETMDEMVIEMAPDRMTVKVARHARRDPIGKPREEMTRG